MTYDKYLYLYPPRPEQRINAASISLYDNLQWIVQPKYNGAAALAFLDGKNFCQVMNRHNQPLTNVKYDHVDFRSIHRGSGWMVVCGEYLNKNKRGEDGTLFNHRFIMYDILVYESQYLIGETTEDRLLLLEKLFPCQRSLIDKNGKMEMYEHICCANIQGVYKSPSYMAGFKDIYDELVKTELYEGLVIKRANAKLSVGFNENNNSDWQLKVRKETKNYKF